MAKPRLTWRDRRHGNGSTLSLGGRSVGWVRPDLGEKGGWHWIAGDAKRGIPAKVSYKKPVPTIDKAKEDCEAYVRKMLAESEGKKGNGTK